MNTKIRALIWEELRTGGVIAGWCTGMALVVLVLMRLLEGWEAPWRFVEL